MKNKIVLLIGIVFIFIGCESLHDPDYTYSYKANVTYTDGTSEILEFSADSFNGNIVSAYITRQDGAACLVTGCGFYKTVVACGVRKFKMIEEDKTLINTNE